jgi:hypothetical protein
VASGASGPGARASIAGAPRLTPPPPPSPLGADFRAAAAPPAPLTSPGPPDEWHVAIDDHPIGPIQRDEVARKIAAGALGLDSLAWREGLDDWMPIREIPELRTLCETAGGASLPRATPSPPAIGGRAGAAPGFSVHDWASIPPQAAPPGAAPPRASVTSSAPSEAELSALRGTRVSVPVRFAVACGFAFLMSLVAIFGARFLAKDSAPAAPAAPVVTVAATEAAPERPSKETVIELEEQVLDEPLSDKPRSSGTSAARPAAAKPKKELTEAQKAMLERMGGEGADLSGLAQKDTGTTGPARSSGSLTAQQLSGVINRNKKQLQRCYETSARGAGSDDTVRLDVSITVAPSGGVSSTQVNGQGLPGMAECIERSVRAWRFPSSGEPVTTRFPLLFQPGS